MLSARRRSGVTKDTSAEPHVPVLYGRIDDLTVSPSQAAFAIAFPGPDHRGACVQSVVKQGKDGKASDDVSGKLADPIPRGPGKK